jgi:hypothetical protein
MVVGRYGFTVPWLDEYNHITQLVRLHLDGELPLEKIGMQVGDHRLFFPFLLSLIFVDISGGNTAFELGFSILLMLMSLYLVYRIYKLQHPGEEHALYFLIPCAFLLFSPGQHDNWIWGNQKCIFMMLACVYVAAWSLERFPRSRRAFVIGVCAAVVASWSFLSGNVLWLVIPIALWLNGYRKISTYLIWIGIAGIHFLLFFNGYVHRPFGGSQGGLADRFYILYHMLAYIGGPFSPETHFILEQYSNHALIPNRTMVAQIMGMVGLLLLGLNGVYAIFVRKMRLREFSSWSLLIGFGLEKLSTRWLLGT